MSLSAVEVRIFRADLLRQIKEFHAPCDLAFPAYYDICRDAFGAQAARTLHRLGGLASAW